MVIIYYKRGVIIYSRSPFYILNVERRRYRDRGWKMDGTAAGRQRVGRRDGSEKEIK